MLSPKDATFAEVIDAALAHRPRDRRILVAVDGIGASGKSLFAASCRPHIVKRPVVVDHVDDFFNPPDIRHARGRFSPEGFWLDTYNYDALIGDALAPLSADGSGRYRSASFNRETGVEDEAPERQAPGNAVVIVEGAFLHRPELVGFWDFSIFLDVPFDEAKQRMNQRAGHDLPDTLLQRYFNAQRIYFRAAMPWERASIVIDNHDFREPRIIAPADSAAVHVR